MPDDGYYGLLASTWDIWRDDTANWSDRFFYLDIIGQYGEPVLDIGCGTGRLLLDYLAEGLSRRPSVMRKTPRVAAVFGSGGTLNDGLPPQLARGLPQYLQFKDLPGWPTVAA